MSRVTLGIAMVVVLSVASCGVVWDLEGGGAGGAGGSAPTGDAGRDVGDAGADAPESAWTVNLSGGTECQIFNSTRGVGEVTVSTVQERVDDGVNGASVTCSVTGKGPFVVNAIATLGPDSLNIIIPSLPAGATAANPAIGSVSYESDATVASYTSNNCDFYFANGQEGVGPGHVWVAFTCAALSNGGMGSTCPVTESVALFENCALK